MSPGNMSVCRWSILCSQTSGKGVIAAIWALPIRDIDWQILIEDQSLIFSAVDVIHLPSFFLRVQITRRSLIYLSERPPIYSHIYFCAAGGGRMRINHLASATSPSFPHPSGDGERWSSVETGRPTSLTWLFVRRLNLIAVIDAGRQSSPIDVLRPVCRRY